MRWGRESWRTWRHRVRPQDGTHQVAQSVLAVPPHAARPQRRGLLQPESGLGQEHEFVDRRRPVVLGPRVQYPQFRDEVAKLVELRVDVGTQVVPVHGLPERVLLPADLLQRRLKLLHDRSLPPSGPGVRPPSGAGDPHGGPYGRPLQRLAVQDHALEVEEMPGALVIQLPVGAVHTEMSPARVGHSLHEGLVGEFPLRFDLHGALRRAPGRLVVGQISLAHDLDDPLEHVGGGIPCHDPNLLGRVLPALVPSVREDLEDLVHSVRHADVDRGCPHHDLGENPVMRRRGCECLHDVSVVLPPADVPGIPELQSVRACVLADHRLGRLERALNRELWLQRESELSQRGLDLVAEQAQIALELQEETVVLVGEHVPIQPMDHVHNPVNELPLLCGVQNVAEELAGSGSLVSQPLQYVAVLRAVLGNQSSHHPLKLERVVHHRKGRHLVRLHPILDAATVEEPQVQLLRRSSVGVRLCQYGVPLCHEVLQKCGIVSGRDKCGVAVLQVKRVVVAQPGSGHVSQPSRQHEGGSRHVPAGHSRVLQSDRLQLPFFLRATMRDSSK